MYSFGFVGVFGKANAGKSSLVNALVGEKVAIVSHRPQTTRDNILGIMNGENYQVVFVDTPGIHHTKNQLDKRMMKSVRSALASVDLVLYLVDGTKGVDEEEIAYINHIKEEHYVIKTKIDKKGLIEFDCDFEVSSLTGKNVQQLREFVISKMPKSEVKNFLYDQDYFTDKSVKFLTAEAIREECLNRFDDEIPHGIAVEITRFDERENLTVVEADIVCERERHKGIIIGKGGKNLKEIGQKARIYLEELIGTKVMLKLFVKVEETWRDKPDKLNNLGY